MYAIANPVNYTDPSGHTTLVAKGEIAKNNSVITPALAKAGIAAGCAYMRFLSFVWALAKDKPGLIYLELLLPSPSPCHIPVMLYPAPRTPNIARHIEAAQLTYPMLLTYAGPGVETGNRARACKGKNPSQTQNQLGLTSCDEYPFNSTIEPIFIGASTSFVPESEQRRQGGMLNAFYGRDLLYIPASSFAVVVVYWYQQGVTP